MDKRSRIGLQRAKVREAIGILRGVEELFGVESGAEYQGGAELDAFTAAVDELEKFICDESALA